MLEYSMSSYTFCKSKELTSLISRLEINYHYTFPQEQHSPVFFIINVNREEVAGII